MPRFWCRDCAQGVSSLAEACPNCGRPTEANLPGTPIEHRGALGPIGQAVVGLVILVVCFSYPPLFALLVLYIAGVFIQRSRG